jgi:hypothetical protein
MIRDDIRFKCSATAPKTGERRVSSGITRCARSTDRRNRKMRYGWDARVKGGIVLASFQLAA